MTPSSRGENEHRDYMRMQIGTEVTLDHAGGSTTAKCNDLSSTGMQLTAQTNLAVGDHVTVYIASKREDITELKGLTVQAEVVRVSTSDDGLQTLGLKNIALD